VTGILRAPRRTAAVLAVVLAVAARAHVTIAPGCCVPVPVLALTAGAALVAALAWLAVWTVADFRSPPPRYQPRAASAAGAACSAGRGHEEAHSEDQALGHRGRMHGRC